MHVGYWWENHQFLRFQAADEMTEFSERTEVSQSQSHIATDGQSVGPSWCRAPSGAHDQIFILFESYSPVFMGRPL
jgi:hypothetical protein